MRKASPLIAAAFFFSLYGVMARFMEPYFDAISAIFIRSLWVILILLVVNLKYKSLEKVSKPDIKWFLVNGSTGAFTGVTAYTAANHLSLGTTLFLFYSGATITAYVLSLVVLKEKIDRVRLISLGLAIIGMLIIFNISLENSEPLYLIIGVLAGAGFGVYNVTLRKLGPSYSNLQINLYHYGITAILILMLFPFFDVNADINPTSIIISIIFSLILIVSGYLVVIGFKKMDTQSGSLILLLDPILSTIWGVIFFAESITAQFILGAIIILSSMSIPNINWNSLKKKLS